MESKDQELPVVALTALNANAWLFRLPSFDEAAKYDFIPLSFILPGDYAMFVEVGGRLPSAVAGVPILFWSPSIACCSNSKSIQGRCGS